MKKCLLLVIIPLFFYTCSPTEDQLSGDWELISRFYQGIYQIKKEDNKWNALVLYYNDGTTKYKYDGSKKHYAFKGLTNKDSSYVDGISAATTSTYDKPKTIEINKRSEDTLEVTTYSMNKPIVELWVRKR